MNNAVEPVAIRLGDPFEPGAKALLDAYWRYIRDNFPPAIDFSLDIEALRQASIRFYLAEIDDVPVGCAALAFAGSEEVPPWAELKSMFVRPDARGSGVADALSDKVETDARMAGCTVLRLETGDVLESAQRFYARRGFHRRGPFGQYPDAPRLLFMEKMLLD